MFFTSLKSALRAVTQYPLAFVLAVFPEGIMTLVQFLTEDFSERHPIQAIILIFPFFCISSSMSGALVYLVLDEMAQKRSPKIRSILHRLKERLPQLVLLSLVTGVIYLLGLLAMILPFVLFMTLYSFAPLLLYQDDKSRPAGDFFIYLTRSSALARKAFWTTLVVVLLGVGLGFLSYLVSKSLGGYLGGYVNGAFLRDLIAMSQEVLLSLVLGAFCQTFLATYFLTLEAKIGRTH